jgi:hypothetical protein
MLEEIGSVVPGIVVTNPSGSVEVCGGLVVNDCATPVGDVDEMGSTVPELVVRQPLIL